MPPIFNDDGLLNEKFITKEWNGKSWLWPADDETGWEGPLADWPELRDCVLKHCPDRRVVVQAGGCCGMYPWLLAEYFEQVFTFEPDPVNFHCLVANCKSTRIYKFNAGLSDKPGKAWLRRESRGNVGQYIIHLTTDTGNSTAPIVEVRLMRLDDLGLESCDALLLDVEGHEGQAIEGATETILRCHPSVITTETGNDERIVAELGYRKVAELDWNIVFLRD